MNKNKKIGFGIVGILILVAVFYGGMVYGGNNVRASINSRGSAFGQNGGAGARGTRNGGGFTAGQIIAKDANSITVQIMAGGAGPGSQGGSASSVTSSGSKIIFLGTSTTVSKTVTGAVSDLTAGEQVSITGTPNSDGSINATTVQIRPNLAPSVVR
jgi:hypothetical protein